MRWGKLFGKLYHQENELDENSHRFCEKSDFWKRLKLSECRQFLRGQIFESTCFRSIPINRFYLLRLVMSNERPFFSFSFSGDKLLWASKLTRLESDWSKRLNFWKCFKGCDFLFSHAQNYLVVHFNFEASIDAEPDIIERRSGLWTIRLCRTSIHMDTCLKLCSYAKIIWCVILISCIVHSVCTLVWRLGIHHIRAVWS